MMFHVLCSHSFDNCSSDIIVGLVVRIVGKISNDCAQSESEIDFLWMSVFCDQLFHPKDNCVRHGQLYSTETVNNLSFGEG